MIRILIIAVLWLLFVVLVFYPLAHAQHNHDQHHAFYQNWINKQDKGCCNNDDCGAIADSDERIVGGVLSIRVEGEWCPVLSHHYLKRGNVPNASVSHACVQPRRPYFPANPCDRLLCYQPRPLS